MKMPPRTTLIVAAVIAAATGFVTLNYVSSVSRSEAAQAEPQQRILVAKEDIPARVTIDVSMLKRVSRPVSQVEPGAVLDASKAIGLLSLVSMPAGSTITASRIGRPQSVALAVVLKRGMRAVSIGIDRVKAVGGLIQPGDRVDVIAVPPRVADETPQGRTIIYGALVLASGTQMEQTSQPAAPAAQSALQDATNLTTVTLAVTPAQADVLASADVNATLRLALRSPQDPIGAVAPERFILPVAHAAQHPVTPVAPPITIVAPPAAAAPQPPAPAAARPKPALRRSGPEIIEEHVPVPKAGS